jgi:ADP-ribose pyrophosphatase
LKTRSTKKSKPKILSSKSLYQGRVFGVRRDLVIEPTGVKAHRDIVTHPGSVVVMPVFPNGDILMIRQYRHTARQFLWELVAGRKEPHESPLAAAKRELHEETGYRARRLRKLLKLIPTPGFVAEWMTIFLAEDLTAGAAAPEEDEKITMRRFTRAEILRAIHSNRLVDAKSVAAILFYFSSNKSSRRKR